MSWNPFGVMFELSASGSNVVRTSATQFTVKIKASWQVYYDGAQTNYGMTASSGGKSVNLNTFGVKSSGGAGEFTGTYSISGNGSATKTITVTFKNYNDDNGDSATTSISFDVTVPAWTSYTVSYNANGGSGAPSSQTKWKDTPLAISTTKPTKSGYTFVGWGTSATDTSAKYVGGENYTANASTTLYAIWKKTITLTYNANGGGGAPSSQSATIYNATTNYKFTLSNTKPTRSGYLFLGWSTSSTATSSSYQSGGTITLSSSDTLYAVWQLNEYTILYNANGGTGAPSSQTKIHDKTLTLSSTIPKRTSVKEDGTLTEYIFSGWSTSSTATSVMYKAGASFSENKAVTLYAVWRKVTTVDNYSVSYNTNGGSEVLPQVKIHGTSLILRATEPVKNGYTFVGWGLSADASVSSYGSGDVYTDNKDIILYAIWESWSHTVKFDLNGGFGNVPNDFVKTTEEDVMIPDIIPIKNNCIFKCWSTSKDGIGGNDYYIGDGYTEVKNGETITLYAIWYEKKIKLYYDGQCEASEFIEGSDFVYFKNNGAIYALEFIEDSVFKIDSSIFHFDELIER